MNKETIERLSAEVEKMGEDPLIEPLFYNVVLIPDRPKTESEGGLALPEGAAVAPPTSIVYAIGPLVMTIVVGDKILVPAYAGVQLAIDKFVFAIVKEEDILARVTLPESLPNPSGAESEEGTDGD